MEALTTTPSLGDLETELAAYYAGIGVLLEECYMPGAGVRALGIEANGSARAAPLINVHATEIGKMLPVWARYAYEGVFSTGYSVQEIADNDGPFEQLSNMLNLLAADDPYFSLCIDAAEMCMPRPLVNGSLNDLLLRTRARAYLDTESSMEIRDLALLANMNERSVRNATASGELKIDSNGRVDNDEAKQWLAGRRGYTPSTFPTFPENMDVMPDSLNAVEIPNFLCIRLDKIWSPSYSSEFKPGKNNRQLIAEILSKEYPEWATYASEASEFSAKRLVEVTELPLNVKPSECESLAKLIKVDKTWFTFQVMTALFPNEMDLLMNPTNWQENEKDNEFSANAVTITLTAGMLANGYIDIPMSAKSLFPEDCFGGRGVNETADKVTLIYGSHQESTDIRIKSAKTISPRKRFGAWLNQELGARTGDRIRCERLGEREYKFTHIPS